MIHRLLLWLARRFAAPVFWLPRHRGCPPCPRLSFIAFREYWRRIFRRNAKRPWGRYIWPLWRA